MARKSAQSSWFDCFAPETGEVGIVGVITSLSADGEFLESALESFTTSGPGKRPSEGRISLTLFADPCQPMLPPIPGLLQPFPRTAAWSPGQLQHAKIALLLYGPSVQGPPTRVRLIVSTGNWTTRTARGSIDLLWCCDLCPARDDADALAMAGADVLAALDFLGALRDRYLLESKPEAAGFAGVVDRTRELATPHVRERRAPARFIATLGAGAVADRPTPSGHWQRGSLGAQVVARFATGSPRRNLLVCGSGFFEQASDGHQEPAVLASIVASLRDAGCLARVCEAGNKILVANPGMAGAVAGWARRGGAEADGWFLGTPCHPDTGLAEPFHAKYLLLANRRSRITAGQLYLGSGNLSNQGFRKGCSTDDPRDRGNVEAGVVVDVESGEEEDLLRALGILPDVEADKAQFVVGDGAESDDAAGPGPCPVPPVIAAVWRATDRTLDLVWSPNEQRTCIATCGSAPFPIDPTVSRIVLPIGMAPPVRIEVRLTGSPAEAWSIPVFREEGGFCRGAPLRYDLDEALSRIVDFPGGGGGDDDPDDGDDDLGGGAPPAGERPGEEEDVRSYPIHRAMQLVETLASRNQVIGAELFPDWLAHLRRVLIEDMDPLAISAVRGLGVNVLEPLVAEPGFAPPMADAAYRELMHAVIRQWGLDAFPGFRTATPEAIAP